MNDLHPFETHTAAGDVRGLAGPAEFRAAALAAAWRPVAEPRLWIAALALTTGATVGAPRWSARR